MARRDARSEVRASDVVMRVVWEERHYDEDEKMRGSTETELTTVFDLMFDGYLLAAVLHLLSSYPYPRRPFRDLLG